MTRPIAKDLGFLQQLAPQ